MCTPCYNGKANLTKAHQISYAVFHTRKASLIVAALECLVFEVRQAQVTNSADKFEDDNKERKMQLKKMNSTTQMCCSLNLSFPWERYAVLVPPL